MNYTTISLNQVIPSDKWDEIDDKLDKLVNGDYSVRLPGLMPELLALSREYPMYTLDFVCIGEDGDKWARRIRNGEYEDAEYIREPFKRLK